MLISFWPFDQIGEAAYKVFLSVLLFLDSIVYSLIGWVYRIILLLCNANILDNSFEISNLIQRVYVIIGVVVLFLVAYSLLKSMVNPEEALKGKKSPIKVIKDVVISIVLIALVPTIFDFVLDFQASLLEANTIGNLVLGASNGSYNSNQTIDQGGNEIAVGVLYAFLHENYEDKCTFVGVSDSFPQGYNCSNVTITNTSLDLGGDNSFSNYMNVMKEKGNIGDITSLRDKIADGDITYYYIISTVAGVFVLYVLLSYCFDIALRAVKLAVFQLIAPLPILARILPNEDGGKVFSNWLKATISTFIEVFIRLAILFFGVLIVKITIQNVPRIFSTLFNQEGGIVISLFAQMFIIVGIVMFIKQAPQIIKDITGLDGGKYGKALMRGVGMMAASLGGGATAMIRSVAGDVGSDKKWYQRAGRALSAGVGANVRGILNGSKVEKMGDIPKSAGKSAAAVLSARARREAAGGTGKYLKQWTKDKLNQAVNWASDGAEEINRSKEFASQVDSSFSSLENAWKGTKAYADSKADNERLKNAVGFNKPIYENILQSVYRAQGINPNTASRADIQAARELANEQMKNRYNVDYITLEHQQNEADYNLKQIERTERKKKAEGIATAARNIQLSTAKYSDLNPNIDAVISRESDVIKQSAMRMAAQTYQNLDNESNYRRFISDLQSSDDARYKMASDYIDFLDKLNLEVKYQKDQAVYSEQKRASATDKKSGGDKK